MRSTTRHTLPLVTGLLAFTALVLGCAGLSEPPPPAEDTNPPAWEDTAARKAAKNAPRKKRPKKAAPAGPTEAPLGITVPATSSYTAAEVQCTSGFRKRCVLSAGRCQIADVPTSPAAGCEVFFQGAARASFGPVSGGVNLSCTFAGGTASCAQ